MLVFCLQEEKEKRKGNFDIAIFMDLGLIESSLLLEVMILNTNKNDS